MNIYLRTNIGSMPLFHTAHALIQLWSRGLVLLNVVLAIRHLHVMC